MTPQERYLTDPTFQALVTMFEDAFQRHCGTGAGITPSEVREASGFAWQRYAERMLYPAYLLKDGELQATGTKKAALYFEGDDLRLIEDALRCSRQANIQGRSNFRSVLRKLEHGWKQLSHKDVG